MDALHILDEGHTTPARMRGSWAGAMGQFQFMPSTFRRHAVDFDGDGRRDIWDTEGDALASAANYLAKTGWRGDIRWGRAVRLPPGFDRQLSGPKIRKPISEWQALGVRSIDGGDLPSEPDLMSAVIVPRGSPNSAYLVYGNFDVLLDWNRSTSFALAVGVLSDRIAWY
jgi:membrane-bound lytic murein transglycosylase B